MISQKSPLFIYSERRIQVARQKNPNQTNGTNRFYFLPRSAQLINDYRRYAKYREINGGKLLQKNELTKSNYFINYPCTKANLKHFTSVSTLIYY